MIFWLLAIQALLAAQPDDALNKDMEALQGTWFATELRDEERQAPPEIIKQFKLVIKDQKMTFSSEGVSEVRTLGFRIDPSQKPPTIDLVYLGGPHEGKTLLGIYRLEGDTLTVCMPTKPEITQRPTKFECNKGSGLGLFVVKKKVE